MKIQTLALVAAALAAVNIAAEIQSVGGVRPDHELKWGALRVQLDQIQAAAVEVDKLAESDTPENPDAAALLKVNAAIETLALTVDHMADQLNDLAKGG